MKKAIMFFLLTTIIFASAACNKKPEVESAPAKEFSTDAPAEEPPPPEEPIPANGQKIGVAMQSNDLQRINQDGANIKELLEADGYIVDLQYADDAATQASQIESMITDGSTILIIAPVDEASLTAALEGAKSMNIAVISYDRLIMDSEAVDYYVTFDNYMIGTIQGEYIQKSLDLDNADGPFNIELFAGDSSDNNARFCFDGVMGVLNPYIESGKLIIPSGQMAFDEVATPNWSVENAQFRMENIQTANYAAGTILDAVIASDDRVAQGISNALVAAGYEGDSFPLLTGQDCDIASVKNMLAGRQSMSVFKDRRELAVKAVEMVNAIIRGTTIDVNDTTTYNNGVDVVPSFICAPALVTADNYMELLVDSGYYTEDLLE